MQRLDRTGLDRGEGDRRQHALFLHQRTGGHRLFDTLVGQVDIPPAGEAVFEVPLALAVANENELWHLPSGFPALP